MYINWSLQVPGPLGLSYPTYGNYGGPGYSDGEILTSPDQPVDYQSPPKDALDQLFLDHDKAYDSPDPLVRAQGDLALAQGIADIPDGQLSPEASLYGGFAILFALQQLTVVNDHPELLSEQDAFQLTRDAIHDVERGLATAESQDVAGIEAWLGQAAAVAAGDNQTNILDQAVAILSSVELHGLQARFGDVHLAGPELVDTVASAFTAIAPPAAASAPAATLANATFDFSHMGADAAAAAQAAQDTAMVAAHDWLPDAAPQHDLTQPSLPQQPDTLLAAVAQQVPDHAADAIQAMLAQAHGHGFELFA